MKFVLTRKPSASMVVALAALVVALSGTAIAASSLVSGDKLIKKNSLSGNRLRNHSVTATQINLGKLGTVPNAKNSKNATTAKNATNATTAANATALGGQPAASFLTTANRIGTSGIIKATGTSTGNKVLLFTSGPFTVSMTCTKTVSGTSAALSASSTEAGSDINGTLVATANTTTALNVTTATASTTFKTDNDVNIDLEAPSGATAVVLGAVGINSLGTDCWSDWYGVH